MGLRINFEVIMDKLPIQYLIKKYYLNDSMLNFILLDMIEEFQLPILTNFKELAGLRDPLVLSYYYGYIGMVDKLIESDSIGYGKLKQILYHNMSSVTVSAVNKHKLSGLRITGITHNARTINIRITST